MNPKPLLIIVVLLAGSASVAQNSIEYGRLPVVPQKVANPAEKLATRAAGKSSATAAKPSVVEVPNPNGKSTVQDSHAKSNEQVPAKPKPAAVFILSNGEQLESDNYLLTHDSVQLTQNGVPRTIRMSAINRQATIAANKQRGIDLKIPADNSQMVLSF